MLVLAIVGHVLTVAGLLLGGIKLLNAGLDRRFAENDRARVEQINHWRELLNARDDKLSGFASQLARDAASHGELREAIERRAREIAELRLEVARDYVSRELWMEQFGAVQIKLDKIRERLPERSLND